jgi:hypothetical protein
MAKQLKDILAGTKSVKTVPGNLGKDPGVDYEPKAGDEQKFAALHVHQKHDYPHDNEAMFTGKNIPYSLDNKGKESRHGHKKGDDEKAYFAPVKEEKETESVVCNETPKGVKCPVHGMVECWSAPGKKMNEAMSPKQKQHANRVKTMPGKKGHVMGAASNFEAPFHKVHATVTKNGGAKEVVKHELQAKDKHDAIFNVQMMHHKAGHKIHDVKHKGLVKEEVEQIDELSTDLLHRAAHKAAKVAMTDVQGRSGPIFKKRAAQANKFRAKGMEQEKKERAMKEEALDEATDPRDSRPETYRPNNTGYAWDRLATRSKSDPKDSKATKNGKQAGLKHSIKGALGKHGPKGKLPEETIDEVLTKSTTAGETIHDFVHSDNPKFKGKSKEKRKEMALAAYYAKQRNEEVEILEDAHEIAKKYKDYVTGGGSTETASRYKSHVNMLSKKTGEHPDDINKQVRKHVKAMKEDLAQPLLGSVHGSHDIAKYKTNDTEEEIDMVRTELKAIANKTMHMLSNMPADHHIEPWVQAKIAAAKEMISAVHDYMMYSDNEEDEQTDTPMTFPNMANDSASGINV